MKRQRARAKWALIGFFAILGLLTFFSGTIRNLSLPQITAKPVTTGTITPVVACGGMTEAGAAAELSAKHQGTVTELAVRPGDRVRTGDVLMTVQYLDDGTLTDLQAGLKQQEASYQEAKLDASLPSDTDEEGEYRMLQNNLSDALAGQARCRSYLEKREGLDRELISAKNVLRRAQSKYRLETSAAALEAEEAHKALEAARRQQENAQGNESYYGAKYPESSSYHWAKEKLDAANTTVWKCQNRCYAADNALEALQAKHQPAVDAALETVDDLNSQITRLETEYAGCTDQRSCESAVFSANSALLSWEHRQRTREIQDERTATRLAAMVEEIEATKEKLTKLEAELGKQQLKADRDGFVESLFTGDSFEAGEVLAGLQSSDDYTLRCSVPIEEASRLQPGAEARITNQSVGGVSVVLAAVEPDQTDPVNLKSLVFSVVGDNAAPNQSFTLAISLDTSRHDRVVPNAAVYRDSVGYFVYLVETKTTPLGSRSKVRRVDVELLRRDDKYTAVSGELSNRDNVVVLSDAPLADGQAVRFGD